ncbi:MAG: hypothetical protein GQ544_02110, partial [Candidatus Aminicenantes bacterium]|nr:hypothetical protein [Candidatus Aminicenantes bacterium]
PSLVFIFIFVLVTAACTERQTFARQNQTSDLFDGSDITIAVIDSGLGGLAITADVLERIKTSKIFQDVHILFYNALFSTEGGYNSLKTREEKLNVLDSALSALARDYKPDLILIGCNTLSVLYPDTEFSRHAQIPVVGIISAGVDLIAQNLKAHPESIVILFATQTTVEEAVHKHQLEEKGFLKDRIQTQACPDLVAYIERGYDSDETEMLIQAYVDEALDQLPLPQEILVSFNCTHYGYSEALWRKAFLSQGIKPLVILNPNGRMSDFLFPPERQARYDETHVSIQVVSMIKLDSEQIESIGSFLERISPQTAQALRNYEWMPELFEWESLVKR